MVGGGLWFRVIKVHGWFSCSLDGGPIALKFCPSSLFDCTFSFSGCLKVGWPVVKATEHLFDLF